MVGLGSRFIGDGERRDLLLSKKASTQMKDLLPVVALLPLASPFSPFLLLPATASPPGVLRVHSKEGGSSGEPGACRSALPLRPYPRWLSRGGTGALGLPTGFGDFRQIHPKTTQKNEQELVEEPRLLSTQMDVMEVPVLLIRVRGIFYLRGGQ